MEIYDDRNPAGNPDIIVDKVNIKFTTRCQVPARSGHHVIYGEWGRTESTLQRFHGCIDAAFVTSGVAPSGQTRAPAGSAIEVDALGKRATKGNLRIYHGMLRP